MCVTTSFVDLVEDILEIDYLIGGNHIDCRLRIKHGDYTTLFQLMTNLYKVYTIYSLSESTKIYNRHTFIRS